MKTTQITMRRFLSPSCTLEIAGTESPLSRWVGSPTLKHLTFRLWFIDPEHPDVKETVLQGNQAQLEALQEEVETYVQSLLIDEPRLVGQLAASDTVPLSSHSTPGGMSAAGIRLQPVGKLSHELIPGSLVTADAQVPIRLSLVELSDLTAVLDRYATELHALPEEMWQRSSLISFPWQRVAVALVSVGVIGVAARFILPGSPILQTASSPQPESEQLASQTSPSVVPETMTAPQAPSPTPSPLPSIVALPSGSAQLNAQLKNKTNVPASLFPSPSKLASPSPTPSQPQSAPTQIALNPTSQAVPQTVNPGRPQTTVVPPPPSSLNLPPLNLPQTATNQTMAKQSAPSPGRPTATPNLARSEQSGAREQASRQGEGGDTTGLPSVTQPAPAATSLDNPSPTASRDSTAFDVVPQVAEARQYVQQRWQPPTGLNRALEYTLVIGADGTLQRIIPLNQAAINYVSQAGIPKPGQSWVSPLQNGEPLLLRLVLTPDGKVQTFQQ